MSMVIHAAVLYAVLMIIFRVSGKRTISQITTFDFILLLMIGDATQQALLGNDHSITNAVVVIVTLVIIDVGISLVKQRSPSVEKVIDSVPLIIVENGNPLWDRMDKSRIDESDVLEVARETAAVERMDQIKYAVLERSGKISVIPKEA
jgi:uncharacterized membrane protein YcaP (DUF421 family)